MNPLATLDLVSAYSPLQLRVLLVDTNQHWIRVVSAAVLRLGATAMDTAINSRAALSRIFTAAQPYSMLMLQARRAESSSDVLADLTAGDAGSKTWLLLLDDQRHLAGDLSDGARESLQVAGCTLVEQANQATITRAMDQQSASREASPWQVSAAELRAALTGPMLKLRYQPIVNFGDGMPIGVEVLARLAHPRLGMIAAGQFIPQMEAAGLAPLLTTTMISQAMQDTCRHGLVGLGLRIGLNVPLNVLMMPSIFELLETQRQTCAVPAEKITLELTETQPVTDIVALRGVIHRLRGLGYRVAIDDASPAIANIEALLGLGFTTVKIDKSMVQAAARDPNCHEFIEWIGKLCNKAGVQTVAEGIEDIETRNAMRDLKVDCGQGYLIGRPIPPAAVKPWLDAWQQKRAGE